MSDIAKCHGDNCAYKDACYRYTAPADDNQSYADFQPAHCLEFEPIAGSGYTWYHGLLLHVFYLSPERGYLGHVTAHPGGQSLRSVTADTPGACFDAMAEWVDKALSTETE